MKEPQKILVLDFDGVICNSIHESFMTALNTYIQSVPNHHLPLKKPLEPQTLTAFENTHPDLFRLFSQFLPMGNRAEDYFVILLLIDREEAEKAVHQAGFDSYRASIPPETLEAFHSRFYQTRNRIRQAYPRKWSEMLQPFPGVVNAIPTLSRRFVLAIATAKDRTSVDFLLRTHGLSKHFRPENILDKDFAKSKRAHLVRFHEEYNVPFQNIYFIDDKILHLVSVRDLGVRTYLALWGFNTEREHRVARKEGIPLLRLEDLQNLGNP